MSQSERNSISGDLNITWVTGGHLDYSSGSWVSERSYSKGGNGLVRQQFIK